MAQEQTRLLFPFPQHYTWSELNKLLHELHHGWMIACWLGEKLGRKKIVLVGATIMTVSAILQISAFSITQMIVGRIVAGIGNGMDTATAPVWQSETSTVKWGGTLAVIEMILNAADFSLSNWMTYGFSFVRGPISWRYPLAFQLVFIVVLYSTVPWLPESPRLVHSNPDELLADRSIADG